MAYDQRVLRVAVDKIAGEILERTLEHTKGDSQIPKSLYHYTSFDGALGILESEAVWLTADEWMNDPNEVAHGELIVEERISLRRRDDLTPAESAVLDVVEETKRFSDGQRTYVFSLSALRDDLAQWTRYAAGARGVAVEFGVHDLTMIVESQAGWKDGTPYSRPSIGTLGRVRYDTREQEQLVDFVLDEFLGSVRNLEPSVPMGPTGATVWRDFGDALVRSLQLVRSFLKAAHPWQTEKEFRLVVTPFPRGWELLSVESHEVQFRTGDGFVMPYITIPLRRSSITVGARVGIDRNVIVGAMVGPLADERAQPGLEAKLGTRVSTSPIQIR